MFGLWCQKGRGNTCPHLSVGFVFCFPPWCKQHTQVAFLLGFQVVHHLAYRTLFLVFPVNLIPKHGWFLFIHSSSTVKYLSNKEPLLNLYKQFPLKLLHFLNCISGFPMLPSYWSDCNSSNALQMMSNLSCVSAIHSFSYGSSEELWCPCALVHLGKNVVERTNSCIHTWNC